jgi:plasmid stabilization system protein ParE
MEVIWSAKAKITFFSVIDYLNDNWSKKEMIQFNHRTQIVINAIVKNPGIFSISATNKEIRRAVVDKNNSFFYRIDTYNQKIHLLTFFDSRQDPKKLKLK